MTYYSDLPVLVLRKVDDILVFCNFDIGEHSIGRGPLLACTSKKVSRKHALIRVTQNDGIFLQSTHNNPCFHRPVNTQNVDIITFGKEVRLTNGDHVSLALDHGWFYVKINQLEFDYMENANIGKEPPLNENNKRELDMKTIEPISKKNKCHKPTASVDNQGDNDPDSTVEKSEENNVDSTDNIIVTNIKSEPLEEPDSTNDIGVHEIKEEPMNYTTIKQEPLDSSTSSESNIVVKQEIKTETNDETSASSSAHCDIDDTNKKQDDTNKKQDDKNQNASNVDAPSTSGLCGTIRRDRCWYGKKCYRKNQAHRVEFSHPNDSDYDSDPNDTRPICCYGSDCYRRNRIHRQRYRHPGQDKLPDPPSKKKRRQQKPSAVVRLYTRSPSPNRGLHDEDEYDLDDPFLNDGSSSDEFEPESSETESEEESSQSQNVVEEDTKQLLRDAKRYMRRR